MSILNSGLLAGKIITGGLLASGLFSASAPFPGSLFSGGYVGAWLDINELTLLYTTSSGSTNVSAVSDAIGRAETKSGGTVNALQSTSSLRPILGQWPSAGRYHIYHDRTDDKLTLAGMPAGTYTIGTASFAGVQIYEGVFSAGILNIPGVDFTELLIINRSLTTTEKTNLNAYLATKTPTIGATDVLRIYCYSSSVNLAITESAVSGATWELSDGQTATGISCVKTITPPQSVILRVTDPAKITSVTLNSKSLYGQIFIKKLVNLVSPLFYSNQFSGFTGSVSAALANLLLKNNLLTSTAVNAVLSALVAAGRTSASGTCVVDVGGTGNAAPTGQGITDKATLISRGWTVTTN